MKCPNCQAENPDTKRFCGSVELRKTTEITGINVTHDRLKLYLERYINPAKWAERWPRHVHQDEEVVECDSDFEIGYAKRLLSYEGCFDTHTAPPGKVFVIVDFLIENRGRETLIIDESDIRLIDSADSIHTPVKHDSKWKFDFGTLHGPGFKTGEILFEIDKGTEESMQFVYKFTDSWDSPEQMICSLRASPGSEYYN